MRRLIILLCLSGLFISLFSQEQLQNGSFENWDSYFLFEGVSGWAGGVHNPVYLNYSDIKYEDAYSGNYAVRLNSFFVEEHYDTVFSLVYLGQLGEDGPESGIPYDSDFNQISGYYKYNMQGNDSASIVLVKYLDSEPTWFIKKISGVQEEWTSFTFDVPAGECDSVFIGFTSTDPWDLEHINFDSWFAIDSVHFKNTEGDTPELLPNHDFEEWEDYFYNEPDFWHSFNHILVNFNEEGVSQTEDAYEGMYAVKLRTLAVTGVEVFPTYLSYGEISPSSPDPFIPVPYSDRPTKISGYYKYFPELLDHAFMVCLFLLEGDTIGGGVHTFLPTDDNYVYFEEELNFYIEDQPDGLVLLFCSGYDVGSTLFLDNVSFDFETIVKTNKSVNDFNIYPNPANNFFICNFEKSQNIAAYIEIIDLQGRIVKRICNENSKEILKIDISNLSKGLYYVRTDLIDLPVKKIIVN